MTWINRVTTLSRLWAPFLYKPTTFLLKVVQKPSSFPKRISSFGKFYLASGIPITAMMMEIIRTEDSRTVRRYHTGLIEGQTELTVDLYDWQAFEFPLSTLENSGTPPEPGSVVRRIVQHMNQETFSTLTVNGRPLSTNNGFVSGHLQSQSYGGRGNDSNLIPMTRSLNALYHNRMERLIKEMRRTFPESSANVRMEVRLYFEPIMSDSGAHFLHVNRIRVNVSLSNATEEEMEKFDQLFCQNEDYRNRTRTGRVTIQMNNTSRAQVLDMEFSSETTDQAEEFGDEL